MVGGVMMGANEGVTRMDGAGMVVSGGRVGDDGGDVAAVDGACEEMGVIVGEGMATKGPEEEIEVGEEGE